MLRMVARLRARGARDAGKIALHQRDAGALDGDFGAGAHGDADIGLGQRGRVVDAVAGHGDDAALGRQPLDDAVLVLRQHIGLDFLDAELAGDRLGGRLVVAGQHDDPDAVVAQAVERRSASTT